MVAPQRLLGRLGFANLWQESNLRLLAATGSAAALIGVIIATKLG